MKITVRTNDAGGSIVTNSAGNPVHVLAYVPFGENLLDLSSNFETDYKFGGYMYDYESGLIDTHARYLGSAKGYPFNWSTDPLWYLSSDKTSYHQASNDPINIIDPTGMADYFSSDGVYFGNDGADNDFVRITTAENWKMSLIIYSLAARSRATVNCKKSC